MHLFWCKLKTYFQLGIGNVFSVALYRFGKKIGYFKYLYPIGPTQKGPFFSVKSAKPEKGLGVKIRYFSRKDIKVSSPPDWLQNPWTGTRCSSESYHWSEIGDFVENLGDIKIVWELSRFDWLPRMAREYRLGDDASLARMELWLRDWFSKNPENQGVNWKCGQEASFRCFNLLLTALILDGSFEQPSNGVLNILAQHLRRIVYTMRYALAQDNNHAISETAALFVVGEYLALYGNTKQKIFGQRCAVKGRENLEKKVQKLFFKDGSFSQHSVVYHRLVLDVLSFIELLRLRLDLPSFSFSFYGRVKVAVEWLLDVVDYPSGDAPNLGANDGSYLFNIEQLEYRDFRPSSQLAVAVFLKQKIWEGVVLHPLLKVFHYPINMFPKINEGKSFCKKDGGYACLKKREGYALLRLPIYKYRPSHADGLHLDIWHHGINWVHDSGSYSYNADSDSLRYYPGTISHSTICFDNRDQMKRLGRFLFGEWLDMHEFQWQPETGIVNCSYIDAFGVKHHRKLCQKKNGWMVIDEFSGFKKNAVIRWHLKTAPWKLETNGIACDQVAIAIESNQAYSLALNHLPESRYYFEQRTTPVLEIKCLNDATVTTDFTFI